MVVLRARANRIFAALMILFVAAVLPLSVPGHALAACPERPACRGCGCKGGPGYRGPDGHCVSFKALEKTCGRPATSRCTFENAPGTGLNRDCAIGEGAKQNRL